MFKFIGKFRAAYKESVIVHQMSSLYINDRNALYLQQSARWYSTNEDSKCWNCQYPRKIQLFCSKCNVLQEPPENLTYFDIMGLSTNYMIIAADVNKKYKELQKQLHPDKFSTKSKREKEISEKLSSLVNKAYSTLTHPLKRGLYMLRLSGTSIPEAITSLNPQFLMEVMEKNEQIEAAQTDKEKILALWTENRVMLDSLAKDVADAFATKNIEKAKELLIKMKYFDSIETRLKKLRHDLGIIE